MTKKNPAEPLSTEPRTKAGRDLLDVIGEVVGYPVTIESKWVGRVAAIEAEAAQRAAPRHRDYAGNVLPSIRFKEGACRWCDSFGSHSADCPIRLEFENEGAAPRGNAERAEGPSRAKVRYDAISAANDKWPNPTRHSTTLRRGFIEGYVTALAAPRAEGLPDMSVLAAILDDVPAQVANTLSMDGEGLAAWIVGHWPEYARLSRPSDEKGTARANCSRFRHDEHCDHD